MLTIIKSTEQELTLNTFLNLVQQLPILKTITFLEHYVKRENFRITCQDTVYIYTSDVIKLFAWGMLGRVFLADQQK